MPQPPSAVNGAANMVGVYRADDYGGRSGTSDASGGINLAAFVAAAAGGGLVGLDSGLVYNVRRTINLPANVELNIPTGTVLRAAGGLAGDVVASSAAGVRISGGGIIDGNRGAGGQTSGNGVTFTGCTEPQVEEISIVNCFTDGIALANCIRPVVDVFSGANGRHGVYHSGTTFARGQVTVRDNGQRVAGSGLVFDAASTDNAYAPLMATDTRAGGSKTQLYGMLEVAASACDRNVIAAAALTGNATGTLSLVGASSGLASGGPTGAAGGQLAGTYPNPTLAGYPWVNADIAGAAAIASSKLAGYPWHNADIASDLARANLLVNGGHENWQRGNGPFTTTTADDRWAFALTGSDTLSVVKDTTHCDTGSLACAAITFVLGTGAGATRYGQNVKTVDGYQVAGKTVAFSGRRSTTTAAAVRVGITTDGTGGTTTFSGFHTGGGTYETLTAVVAVPADATFVRFSTYFAASCLAYVDNDQAVYGAVAVDYVALPPADDLARCLRYYQRWTGVAANQIIAAGNCHSANGAIAILAMQALMGGTPTLTVSAIGGLSVQQAALVSVLTALSLGSAPAGNSLYLLVTPTGSPLTPGNAVLELSAAAWLALEWTP